MWLALATMGLLLGGASPDDRVSPDPARPGESAVFVTAEERCDPYDTYRITWDGREVMRGELGEARLSEVPFTVPAGAEPGAHKVLLECGPGLSDDATVGFHATATVEAAAIPEPVLELVPSRATPSQTVRLAASNLPGGCATPELLLGATALTLRKVVPGEPLRASFEVPADAGRARHDVTIRCGDAVASGVLTVVAPSGPSPRPSITLRPGSVPPGGRVRIVPSGFAGRCAFTATFDRKRVELRGGLRFTVPKNTEAGRYPVRVTCANRMSLGQTSVVLASADDSATATLTVTPPSAAASSAWTWLADLSIPVAALLMTVLVTVGFLSARALALGDRLLPRRDGSRRFPSLSAPADPFNRALEALSHHRGRVRIPERPWLAFLVVCVVAASLQTVASSDAWADHRPRWDTIGILLLAFVPGTAIALVTYALTAHWREVRRATLGGFAFVPSGLVFAAVAAIVSAVLQLNPGYFYGLVGVFTLGDRTPLSARYRRAEGIAWGASATLAAAAASAAIWWTAGTDSLFCKTITVVILETALFALLPIPSLDGAELLNSRPRTWTVLFSAMFGMWVVIAVVTAELDQWGQFFRMTAAMAVAAAVSFAMWRHVERDRHRE
ncbi:hypothetical protein ACIBH1_36970 [Nonomuraea sp. NPDC050663]|uniref:hypothetical protein n=1 Tax=Nonomuraea sp. NPDC050663 TaxID=3364370 RepID=UPI0037A937FA